MIFSADDFGLDDAVNEAVEIAHRDGLLSSTSLMIGEMAAADAVARARRLPDLKVGLHITLVEGMPVSPPAEISDLVDAAGRFPGEMVGAGFKFFFKPGIRRQLAREIHAQFAAFAATGLALDHVNTHKHIHLHPTVADLIIRIGRDFGLKAMRLPVEPEAPLAAAEGRPAAGSLGAAALRLWTRQLRRVLRRAGITTNDHVFGLAWSGAMTEERVLGLVPHLPDGVSEIYFHPARALTPALARTMPTYRPAEELQALLSPRIGRALAAAGITRTSFGALTGGGTMIRAATIFGLLGLALFTGLLVYQGAGQVGTVVADAGIGFLWASLFHVVPMIVNAEAWRLLFVAGPVPSLVQMIYAVWIRESVNGLLPVARIGGEVVSYRVLTRMGFRPAPVAASLIADITLSMVSQFIFTITGLVLLLLRIDDTAEVWRVIGGLMVFLPLVAGMVALQRIGIVNLGARLVGTLFGERWSELVGNAARLDRVLRLIYMRLTRVVGAVVWQLAGWTLGAGEIWLALRFLGHPIDLYDAFLLEAVAQAVSSAAFVVPGAIGIQEGAFLLFGTMLGLDPQVALAVAIARRIRDVIVFVPGLVVWQVTEAQKLVARRNPAE